MTKKKKIDAFLHQRLQNQRRGRKRNFPQLSKCQYSSAKSFYRFAGGNNGDCSTSWLKWNVIFTREHLHWKSWAAIKSLESVAFILRSALLSINEMKDIWHNASRYQQMSPRLDKRSSSYHYETLSYMAKMANAFDQVWYKTLLSKISSYELPQQLCEWIKNFLQYR